MREVSIVTPKSGSIADESYDITLGNARLVLQFFKGSKPHFYLEQIATHNALDLDDALAVIHAGQEIIAGYKE
jgi:hypothetical protein